MKKTISTSILLAAFTLVTLLSAACSSCNAPDTQGVQSTSESQITPEHGNEYSSGLVMSGSFYDNIDCFETINSYNRSSDLAKEYLRSIKYDVIQFDSESGVAKIEVSMPDIAKTLESALNGMHWDGESNMYAEMLTNAKNLFSEALKSSNLTYIVETFETPIKNTESGLKIVIGEEWNEMILENIETSYNYFINLMTGGMISE